jgi:peptidoglycan LD-endopeptidase LytH
MLAYLIQQHKNTFYPVIACKNSSQVVALNFTTTNAQLLPNVLADVNNFSAYISNTLNAANCLYGYGGYAEDRVVYNVHSHFDTKAQPRTIHLGVDIWCAAGTAVFAPFGGMVHSFAYNKNKGDYGATIILLHQLNAQSFYTLYGHLALSSLQGLAEGQYISRAQNFATLGQPHENGGWPPHLHFQVIEDMEFKEGDYPGVCTKADAARLLKNCPDPAPFFTNFLP